MVLGELCHQSTWMDTRSLVMQSLSILSCLLTAEAAAWEPPKDFGTLGLVMTSSLGSNCCRYLGANLFTYFAAIEILIGTSMVLEPWTGQELQDGLHVGRCL